MTVDRRSIAIGTPADSKYPSLESIYSSISSIPRRFSACALYCPVSLPSVLEGSTELPSFVTVRSLYLVPQICIFQAASTELARFRVLSKYPSLDLKPISTFNFPFVSSTHGIVVILNPLNVPCPIVCLKVPS
ncbi:uncharacterized protein IAS62_005764 [Cryptococcus decagattii]|uniref:Uncharacterized protein n=1 Tax=Cryptococcus decagattii TaxID=1859122 RepID=A0ABZ2B0S0_9TREE